MKQFKDNDAFCPLPWTGVYIDPDGNVDNCCISQNKLGNINQTPLKEILNSKKNIEIKSEMLSGKRVDGCRSCYPASAMTNNEDQNVLDTSQRMRHIERFERLNSDVTIYNDPNNIELQYLDLRFRNTCNYACVYCGPGLSSLWATELNIIPSIHRDVLSDTLDYILENIKTVNSIYLAGGEPLLMKENEVILENLVEINPDCKLIVNTNLSITKNNRIFDLIQQFKNVQWIISVDDIEERYEYIRYPGKWDNFLSNLLDLKKNKPPGHSIVFNMVYCALNAKTIFSAIDHLSSFGFAKYNFAINYTHGGFNYGLPLDPRQLPKKYLQEVIEVLKNRPGTGWPGTKTRLQLIEDCINLGLPNDDPELLFNCLADFDQRRGTDSKKVFPDIYAARQ